MYETEADVVALQQLLDDSHARAGPHLASILTPEHHLTAADVAARLTGMRLLALATVTADGRPLVGPVDGIFYRGAFHFGSSLDSVRLRHLRRRPYVSATHLPGEELAVTVHGRGVLLDMKAPEHGAFRRAVLDIYLPRYGAGWEEMLDDAGTAYVRIEAERMFTFAMDPGAPAGDS